MPASKNLLASNSNFVPSKILIVANTVEKMLSTFLSFHGAKVNKNQRYLLVMLVSVLLIFILFIFILHFYLRAIATIDIGNNILQLLTVKSLLC